MLTRRIGWRLNTLLTSGEREILEALLTMGPAHDRTEAKIKALMRQVRNEHRVIFGKVSRDNFVTYKNYAGNEDEVQISRLFWNFFPGTIEERGGIIPVALDVAWTANLVVMVVRKSLLIAHDDIETEIEIMRKPRTIEEVLNDGEYIEPVRKILEPIANELATGLMMKR